MKSIGIIGFGTVGRSLSHSLVTNSLTNGQPMSVFNYDIKDQHKKQDPSLNADIVFICLPTQISKSTDKYDLSVIIEYINKINDLSIIVIRSTLLPGDTNYIKSLYPNKNIIYFPEFLTENNAINEAKFPDRYIVGCSDNQRENVTKVISIMPKAKNILLVSELEAEWIKQLSNFFLTMKVTFANMFFEYVYGRDDVSVQNVLDVVGMDPRIGKSHLNISDEKRGAGGKCLIKDTTALKGHTKSTDFGNLVKLIHESNINTLLITNKDTDLVQEVYVTNKPRDNNQV